MSVTCLPIVNKCIQTLKIFVLNNGLAGTGSTTKPYDLNVISLPTNVKERKLTSVNCPRTYTDIYVYAQFIHMYANIHTQKIINELHLKILKTLRKYPKN